jgi:hypothetical protein
MSGPTDHGDAHGDTAGARSDAPAARPDAKPGTKAGRGPARGSTARPGDPSLEEQVEAIHDRLVTRRGSELIGLLEIIASRRKLMWLNFNAGLARGVGFFLGVTMIGALVLGGVALAFNFAAHSLGYTEITLEDAVTSTVRKFSQIRNLVVEAEAEVQSEQQAAKAKAIGTEPEPGVPRLELPGSQPKGY